MRRVTIYIDSKLWDTFCHVAVDEHTNKSRLIHKALTEYLRSLGVLGQDEELSEEADIEVQNAQA